MNASDLLSLGIHASQWGLTSGGEARFYVDLDDILSDPTNIESIAKRYVQTIREINQDSQYGSIDRLAFIEKDSGPIGALSLKDLLVVRSGIPAVVIRVKRRILSAAVKSGKLVPDERVLVVSDVATSGGAILQAARVIWRFGSVVPSALVFFDRRQGARENLRRADIRLYNITDPSNLPDYVQIRDEDTELSLSTLATSSAR